MPDHDKFEHGHKFHHYGMDMYYTELIKIITILFVGVLATMTFLLTVGFQRPHAVFSYAMYASIVTLGLNLLAYVAGHMMAMAHHQLAPDASVGHDVKSKDKDDDDTEDTDKATPAASSSKWEQSRRRLMVMRTVQQVLFVLAVLCVVWLALAAANFFFTLPTQSSGGVTPQ